MAEAAPDPLQVIRGRIDAIDEAMHRLLIERSGVIAELIEIKGPSSPGGAFRPGREADMMRRMVLRHEGGLPLVAVEHIWREIISTFTAMQAPFGIASGPAVEPSALRDAIRFYFGFSVPVTDWPTAEAAIARVAGSARDIAVLDAASDGRWWAGLGGEDAPKILARLPFIELAGRPAGFPAYVVGPPLKDSSTPDIAVIAIAEAPNVEAAILSRGGRLAGQAGGEMLVELPIAASLADIAAATGSALGEVRSLGGFFQPIRFVSNRTA